MILYILLSGQLPFKGKTKKAILDQIASGTYDFEGKEWQNISEDAKNYVSKLLTFDPAKRYSAEQALEDPWIIAAARDDKYNTALTANALENLRTYRVTNY